MSIVTNLILITPHEFKDCLRSLNEFLYPYSLVSIDSVKSSFGGPKNIEACIYMGAYNNIDVAGFLNLFKNLDWGEYGDLVQLLVKKEEDECFVMEFAQQPN